jgi:hypothetical protein
MDEKPLPLIRLLLARLERISVDSVWAHRASGVRGSLLRILDEEENNQNLTDPKTVSQIIATALHILAQAAKRE